MTLIGVHEMHGRLNNDLFAHDPLPSSGYPMITYAHPVASNLPIKLWLLGDCKTKLCTKLHQNVGFKQKATHTTSGYLLKAFM